MHDVSMFGCIHGFGTIRKYADSLLWLQLCDMSLMVLEIHHRIDQTENMHRTNYLKGAQKKNMSCLI